jgi:hypothetical protein
MLKSLEVGDSWKFGKDFKPATIRKYAREIGITVMIFSGLNSLRRMK